MELPPQERGTIRQPDNKLLPRYYAVNLSLCHSLRYFKPHYHFRVCLRPLVLVSAVTESKVRLCVNVCIFGGGWARWKVDVAIFWCGFQGQSGCGFTHEEEVLCAVCGVGLKRCVEW